ncbi:class I adenylate-forming enzyme family protein [Novosphingobium sp. TH158]|uniref:class I adenylate-forming enzyme family protein n=1 Tax=Novosphingobium sp. TH158 TaxID=2067455 RepID=UPI000C7B89E2|nr:class I adenylate-forming enzyme family protein [Novosphingobium sp. TH158]PLK27462.1 AMP-dependent synthetase [Novosphingobium sp. TH158]
MPSDLDLTLRKVMDGLTAPGAMLETATQEVRGQTYTVFRNAPPSLPALFDAYGSAHAAKDFIVDGELRLTFGETLALAREVGAGLVNRHGLQRGERVGIAARNSANWIIAYMGVLFAGGCVALLNGWWTGEELAGGIRLADCRLILADASRAARLEAIDHGGEVLLFDHGDPREGLACLLGSGEATLPALRGDDLATILFTSGSTGQSKGAVSDHRAVVQATINFAAQTLMLYTYHAGLGQVPDRQPAALVAVPLFHVTGEIPLMLQSMITGRKLVIMPRWDAVEAMRLIEREQVSYFIGVPLMSHEIAMHPDRGRFDLSTCFHFAAGGAPRPASHVRAIRDALPTGYPILGYGLTETNAVGCGNFNENYLDKPNSTGPASKPLVDLAILDDARQPLGPGAVGEVAIRSVCNFLGYWRNEEATRACLTEDGWFLSGDLGYLDEDGYLFIVDRKKDIIIRGGENITASEVEAALYDHPGLAEASVFGLPDERLGEQPVAVYVTHPGADVSEDDLREFLGARLAAFKIPVRFWRESDRLPRLGTEKVDKRSLKARYAAQWNGR